MPAYLLDTNSVIYFFNGEEKISRLVEKAEDGICISFITKIELLCMETDADTLKKVVEFIKDVEVLSIDDEIIEKTIVYGYNMGLKVPDAIIAATAKVKDLTLVTADALIGQKLQKEIKIVKPI